MLGFGKAGKQAQCTRDATRLATWKRNMCRWGIAAIVRSAAVCLEKATCDGWGGAAQRGCDKCGLPFGDQAAVVARTLMVTVVQADQVSLSSVT